MFSQKTNFELQQLLHNGCQQLGLHLATHVEQSLIDYIALLHKWNQTYNLTAVREPREMVIRHLLDSLAITKYVVGNRVLDVGSGAGLPGIPLALALPKQQFYLLDSSSKKIRFLNCVLAMLDITNGEIIQQRVEQFQPVDTFDCVITRAFGSLATIATSSKHLLSKNSILLAMKGKLSAAELQQIDKHAIVRPLFVPFLDEQRHLVSIKGSECG